MYCSNSLRFTNFLLPTKSTNEQFGAVSYTHLDVYKRQIIQCASMKIEEAALTGESVPVDKTDQQLSLGDQKEIPLGDRKNMIYMGSTVVYGRGMAVICDTGMDTEMGKIADALAQAKDGKTPLQIKLSQLSKVLTVLVLAICVVIFAVSLLSCLLYTSRCV